MQASYFDYAFASVPGARHRAAGKPNQDAALARKLPGGGLLFTVADGCSSGQHCEFGARLGLQSFTAAVANCLFPNPADPYFWTQIRQKVLTDLNRVLELFEHPRTALYDYLLFTLAGCMIADGMATFFHFGDGAIIVNGEVIPIPSKDNTPFYIAYALLSSEVFPIHELNFHVVRSLPARELRHALVGTDGVNELIELENTAYPGRDDLIGPIGEFWRNDQYFQNPQALQRTLNRINPVPPPARRGLLGDDTTLFAIRRKEPV